MNIMDPSWLAYARCMRLGMVAVLALAACGDGTESESVDAAATPEVDTSRVPFTTAITTPRGDAAIRYGRFESLGGFCLPGFYIDLYVDDELAVEPSMTLRLPFSETSTDPPATGTTVMGTALLPSSADTTEEVMFELTASEYGSEAQAVLGHFAGRAHADTGAWHFDFTFDAHPRSTNCI